jgi:mono/diheme cytochrome c family protein
MRRLTRLVWMISSALAGGLVVAASAAAQTAPANAAQGKKLFAEHCSGCHGGSGTGNGPAAAALRTRPADLTTIAKRKGAFRTAEVEAVIKGSDTAIPAHGSIDMPVWGTFFTAVDRTDADAQRDIASLVAFIESIQRK